MFEICYVFVGALLELNMDSNRSFLTSKPSVSVLTETILILEKDVGGTRGSCFW